MTRPRLAVRAAILHDGRLLLVNAYPGRGSDLWCLPGGGVERGQSLPDTLIREVFEETGLSVTVGAPILVSEFAEPARAFHQVEIVFRATTPDPAITLADPEGVVDRVRWASPDALASLRHKPDSLARAVWGTGAWGTGAALYDPLELSVR